MDTDEAPEGEADGERVSDLPPEKVHALLERVEDAYRKKGLYLSGVMVQEDMTPDDADEPREHRMIVQFDLGDLAFSEKMDDPENAEINDQLRGIEHAELDRQIEEIREQYRKRPEL